MEIKSRSVRAILLMAFITVFLPAVQAQHAHDHAEKQDSGDTHAKDAGEDEHHDEVALSPEAIQLYGLTVATAKKRVLTDVITVSARVALNGGAMAHVGASVDGRVSELPAQVGDQVKKGDLLAIIDSHVFAEAQSGLLQATSAQKSAVTVVEVARKAFERAQELEPGKGIGVTEFQKREGELKLAEGALMSAESATLAARNKLHMFGVTDAQADELVGSGRVSSRLELRAPLNGEVLEREVTIGEVVGPDRESLMVIADLSTLWVLADVSERDAARVIKGNNARVTLTALPGIFFDGNITYVAPVLDSRTRKATVRIEIVRKDEAPTDDHAHSHAPAAPYTPAQIAEYAAKNDWCAEHEKPESICPECNPALAAHAHAAPAVVAADVLRAGMFGEAELTLSARPGQSSPSLVAVPLTAVQTVEGGPALFVPVAGEANTFAKRAVTIGPRMGRWVPILSGLKDGESYVEAGSFILKADLGKAGAAHEH
ncbi:MAG: efflux RND transporter periplasmic adaptor subunit [Candidatus Sumerlaeota bacterium]